VSWLRRQSRSLRHAESATTDLQQLLDSLSDAVLQLDQLGRLTYANQAWQQLSGHTITNSLNQPLADFLHPQDRAAWLQLLNGSSDLTASGPYPPLKLRLASPDRQPLWCELRLQTLGPQSPKTRQYSATLCDISLQEQEDQQNRATQRGLNALVSRLPTMIYRSRNDRDWTMEYVSEGCLALTGYSADDLVRMTQKSYGRLIHPADVDYVWQQVQEALSQRRSFELNYRLFHTSGQMNHVTEKGHGVYSSNGNVLAVEGVIFARSDWHDQVKSA
jgi:PAS domain S-box-containing protein